MRQACSCKTINEIFDGCIGQVTACETRCRPLRTISIGREAHVPSCWEKTQLTRTTCTEEAP
jgi:hypothetical protein